MDTDSPAVDGKTAAAQVNALSSDRSGADDAASTLVIAAPSVPDALDPLDGLTPLGARIVDDAVFEGLVQRTDTGWPWAKPALADSCVLVPADVPRDVYCHLTPGVTFHDGSAVTVEDVEYSLAYWLDPRRGWLRDRHGLSSLKKIERVDGPPGRADAAAPPGFVVGPRDADHWFRVSFSEPHPLALQLMATMKIVPRASHRGRRRAFAKAPVGTGPMRVTVLEPDRIVLERREALGTSASAGQGDRARRIVLRQIRDGAEVLTLMRRGEVHIATELARTHVPEELAESGMAARFEAWLVSPPRYDVLIYNLRGGLQSGPRLRSALDAGLPRAAIASLLGGAPPLPVAAPVDIHDPTPIDLTAIAEAGHSARWGAAGLVEDIEATQDVQGAEVLATALDSLGWSMERGVRRRENNSLRLVLMWNGASGHGRQVASAIKSAWRGQGVVVPYATASWSYLRGPLRRGEFDLALARMADASDADLYPYFHSRGALNISGIVDAELDAALVAFRLAKTPLARREAETAVAQRLTALRPVSVLHAPTAITLVSRRVQGLRFIDDLPELSGAIRLLPHDRWTLSKR